MTTTLAVDATAARRPVDVGARRPPNRLAEQITGRTYLSHSQISLMRSCPRKFNFLYVEKARPDFIPSSLIFGGSIHAAVELYFRCKLEGLNVTDAALLSAFHDAWRQQLHKTREVAGDDVPVQFAKNQDADTLRSLAARIIAVFLASPLANPRGVIVGIEEELRVVLDPQLPDVLAKVDLLTKTSTSLHVVDFKTSRSSWGDAKARESAEQLLLYASAVQKMAQAIDLSVKLHFAVLTKHKTPRVQLLPVTIDTKRIDTLREDVDQIWQAIQSGHFYPSPSPMNCSTCPFKSRCPVFAR